MAILEVLDPHDVRLEGYRTLSDAALMRARGVFVAEGRLVVARVLDASHDRVQSLLLNEAARRALAPALARLDQAVPIYLCAASAFLRITGFDMHRGCVALVRRPPAVALADLLGTARRVVILDGVANADNVGGVFRNAAAFGADAIVLGPTTCDPLYRKAIRTSMAATLRVPFTRVEAWGDSLRAIKAAGFALVAFTPREPAETLEAFARQARPGRLALVFGAEDTGVSPAAAAAADCHVRIPTRPEVDSLNVAVATGIALSRLL